MLEENAVTHLVDVRRLPGSNRYPHFNADSLADALAEHDIGFTRLEGLAGRRPVSKDIAFEVNAWWENRSFHNYADHALSDDFAAAFNELRDIGRQRSTAIMCAEAVWWRCHRRIIADHLLATEHDVHHIMGPGQLTPATLSAGATVKSDGTVVYPE